MSAAFSPVASVFAGQAQASGYKYNAAVQRQQAGMALDQSYVRAHEIEDQVTRRGGEAKAQLGAAGVVPTSGSALMALNDIATEGEMSRQLALYQGRVAAAGYQQQSDADRAEATAALTGGWVQGVGSFLGNITQTALQAGPYLAGGG